MICDYDVVLVAVDRILCMGETVGFENYMTILLKVRGQDGTHVGFVVHDDDDCHPYPSAATPKPPLLPAV